MLDSISGNDRVLAKHLHGVDATSILLAHLHDLAKVAATNDFQQLKVIDANLFLWRATNKERTSQERRDTRL